MCFETDMFTNKQVSHLIISFVSIQVVFYFCSPKGIPAKVRLVIGGVIKSVRGCIVDANLSVLAVVVVKKGEQVRCVTYLIS